MEDFKQAIIRLKGIRSGVPQFLFKDGVHYLSTIKVKTEVINFKKANPEANEIDVIVSSPGGIADDAYRIIRTLRKNFETVNIIVPFWVKSAATLLSLGGSKIVMDEFGEFGPLDAQIGKEREDSPEFDRESALNDEHSLKRIEMRFKEMYEEMYISIYEHKQINIPKLEASKQLLKNLSNFYKPLLEQIDPYKLGEKRRFLEIGEKYATRILLQFTSIDEEARRSFVDYLVNGCPDHGYVIDYDIVKVFLNNVFTPEEFAGIQYKGALTEFALLLLNEKTPEFNSYVGFIDIEPAGTIANNKDLLAANELKTRIKTTKLKTNGESVIQPVKGNDPK